MAVVKGREQAEPQAKEGSAIGVACVAALTWAVVFPLSIALYCMSLISQHEAQKRR